MSKSAVRSLPRSLAIALLLGAGSPAIAGQAPPGFGGIIGAILNSALTNRARQEWQNRPIADYSCLEAHNVSTDQLASNGIGPNDPRVQRLFAQCARDAANAAKVAISPLVTARSGSYNPDFVVDGLAVGSAVHPESPVYKAYKCRPSDQFPGFTWCAIKHPMTGKFGPFNSWVTILHSDANTAVFILQDVIPAYFATDDVEREIERLSQRFGQAARVVTGDPRPDAPHSVIATWGDVTLTPLDESTLDELRRGEIITAGLLIDFLADSRKSAREGLPVFHMGGGAGYVWAATFDDAGKGRLRITAVNPSLLPASSAGPSPPISYAPTASPTPTPATPDPGQTARDRAERTIAAANQQLEDAADFIKEHADSANLLDYVDRIDALKAAVKNGEPDEIEHKSTDLIIVFSRDKDYQQHLADHGQKELGFILGYIGKNPLADATPALAALVKQLSPALQHGDLNQLQPLVDKIDLAIREANLESAFTAAQNTPAGTTENAAPAGKASPPAAPGVQVAPAPVATGHEGDTPDVKPSPAPISAPTVGPPNGGPGETIISMVADGGTFAVPATINGQLTLNFVVDSGAADVSIPADVVLTLRRTETITDSDFLGNQLYKLADGSTVPSQRFVIRSLKVGDKTFENVVGSIAPVAGSLLLGQSFLNRFKSWSIDNRKQALILN